MAENGRVDGRSLIRDFLEQSPFGRLVGLRLDRVDDGSVELVLPFREEVATAGTLVHGGAISTLVDTAATAAAWATEFEAMPARWGTASLTVNYVRGADGVDLRATARVTKRGGTLSFCEVEVTDDEGVVATGLVVYTLVVPR